MQWQRGVGIELAKASPNEVVDLPCIEEELLLVHYQLYESGAMFLVAPQSCTRSLLILAMAE